MFYCLCIYFFQKGLTIKSMIRDIKGDEMPAIDVFSAAIKYMKDCLLKELKEENDENAEEAESIRWVLTVPAIWDDNAKTFMRKAAEKVLFMYIVYNIFE